MLIGFDWSTEYVVYNPIWLWGASSGFPSAEASIGSGAAAFLRITAITRMS